MSTSQSSRLTLHQTVSDKHSPVENDQEEKKTHQTQSREAERQEGAGWHPRVVPSPEAPTYYADNSAPDAFPTERATYYLPQAPAPVAPIPAATTASPPPLMMATSPPPPPSPPNSHPPLMAISAAPPGSMYRYQHPAFAGSAAAPSPFHEQAPVIQCECRPEETYEWIQALQRSVRRMVSTFADMHSDTVDAAQAQRAQNAKDFRKGIAQFESELANIDTALTKRLDTLETLLIVAVVLAALLLMFGIGFAVWFFRFRKKTLTVVQEPVKFLRKESQVLTTQPKQNKDNNWKSENLMHNSWLQGD